MTVDLEDAPATTNGNGEGPKRISTFKRAIAQLVGLSPENADDDIITAVRSMTAVYKQAEEVYLKLQDSEAKHKALKKKLILMATEDMLG